MDTIADLHSPLRGMLFAVALFASLTVLREDDAGGGSGLAACGVGAGGAGVAGAKVAKGCGSGAKLAGGAAKVGAAGLAGSEAGNAARALRGAGEAAGWADDAGRAATRGAGELGGLSEDAARGAARLPPAHVAEDAAQHGDDLAHAASEEEGIGRTLAEELGPDAAQMIADTGQ